MLKLKEITVTDRRVITVDASDETCLFFGFRANEITGHRADNGDIIKATIDGVGPDKDGLNCLWYHIHSPKLEGMSCHYGGKQRNLWKAGFRLYKEFTLLVGEEVETYVDDKNNPQIIITRNPVVETPLYLLKEIIPGTELFTTIGNFESAKKAANFICCEIV